YHTKNACGTNQMLGAVPGQADAFYWGEWTEGLFRTGDGARSWTDVSAGLPFKRNRTATLVCVTPDPGRPQRVYAGFIGEGLWRSDDRGGALGQGIPPRRPGLQRELGRCRWPGW